MGPVRIEQPKTPGQRLALAAAAAALMIATATNHISAVPVLSTITIMVTAVFLALYLSVPWAVTIACVTAAGSAAIAGLILAATPLEVGMATGLPFFTAGLSLLVINRVLTLSQPEEAPEPSHVDESPLAPILLDMARQAFDPDVTRADIEPTLEVLIDALDCDSLTIWRNADEDQFAGELFCWAGPPPAGAPGIIWSRAPSVAGAFSTGKPYVFTDAAHVPNPDRSMFRRAGITAAASVPVMVRGRWVGHVTVSCHVGTRNWEPCQLDAVTAVAEMVSSVWTRQADAEATEQMMAQRDRSLVIQRALGEASRMLFESEENPAQVDRVLELVLSSTNARVAYAMQVTHHSVFGPGLIPLSIQVADGAVVPSHLESDHLVRIPEHYRPLLEGNPVMISDTSDLGEAARNWYDEFLPTTRAEIVFPVTSGTSVTGILGLTASTERSWDAAEMRTVAAIAQMLGVTRARVEARRGLEDIVKAKDSFIASVSHQLRTPMAVVMGLSSELSARWEDFGHDEIIEFIDLIARESREVSDIIEDLLIAARASADSITVLPEIMRLDETVMEAIHTMSAETTHRLVSVDVEPVSTLADPLRVRQIVRNLVANGHRHGGKQIFVRVAQSNGAAIFEVIDDGAGIPADRRDRIFEAYEAGETDGWTATMGLGLHVSRQLARLMGGDVTYVHEPMPTFRLNLPIGATPALHRDVIAIPHGAANLSA